MGVYLYPSNTETALSNAYIGEYHEASRNGDISKATTYTSFQIASPIQYGYSIQFNPDGTKFYIAGYKGEGTGRIQEYSCSTPRDITTASNTYNVDFGAEQIRTGNYPQMFIGNQGQYLYFYDYPSSPLALRTYSLATAWDLSSTKTEIATYSGGPYLPQWISDDGMAFIWNNESNFSYSTSGTAWAINTSGTNIASGSSGGLKFSSDGGYLYVLLYTGKVLTKYSLSTPRDPTSTQTQEQQVTLSAGGNGFCFDTNGNNMYTISGSVLYQYNLE